LKFTREQIIKVEINPTDFYMTSGITVLPSTTAEAAASIYLILCIYSFIYLLFHDTKAGIVQ
jgi:hypothetical protein